MAWELVIDCAEPDRLAEFWCVALGYERFGQVAQYRSIVPAGGGAGPKVILQQVPEPKRGKNRLHIDLAADDLEAEAARLVAAGARRARAEPVREFGIEWILMEDPEGNEFCIVPA
ncbi:MAG TPA: VOC family protein [Candidatus Dormibacteraeota bacterium]|nr:VOC family protein [Candidatus Dormibacteraeota bacterium]